MKLKIKDSISEINNRGRKVLSVFLTAGFPDKNNFLDHVKKIIDNGADMLEIGVPFGDSLADGPVVQSSFNKALAQGIKLPDVLRIIGEIKKYSDNPVILMSSANPVLKYGKEKFGTDAKNSGVDGLILPDIPLEEFDDFFTAEYNVFDKILLTTPTSSEERIRNIDNKSSGFVYCVSVVGTTGIRKNFDLNVTSNLERTYKLMKKNKMLIGFGIKNGDDVRKFAPYCDGIIVGSAILKSLENDDNRLTNTTALIRELRNATDQLRIKN